MERPSISGLVQERTWKRYKSDIIKVILEALSILKSRDDLIADEVDLTRKLFFCFKRAAYNLKLNYHLPTPEGNNPPFEDDRQRAVRENKRPDFYWQFCDDSVDDPKWCDRRFVLECKRLGAPKPSSPNWILNQNYVQHGVVRFLTEEHGYGKGDEVAGMIGFVESMEFDILISEINTTIATCGLSISPLSIPIEGWQQDDVSQLEHQLIRSFPGSPFQLLHFWLDIRNCNLLPTSTKSLRKSVKQMSRRISGEAQTEKIGEIPDRKALKKQKHKVFSQEKTQLELPIDQL